jgi:phage terminase large subunit GpA-like protein
MGGSVKNALKKAMKLWRPPLRMSIKDWANKFRFLSPVEASRAGKYDLNITPYLVWENGPLDALDDPRIREVVCQKSAQVAWTSGVVGNALGAWIDLSPSPLLIVFAKEGAAKDYMAEKFEPMVLATPRLKIKIPLTSRKAQQRQLFKRFDGGFLKLVGSNSPASVKSTPIRRVIVEEPDDCNANLKNQGDSIKLAKERVKTYDNHKIIIGGTPTIGGVSAVEAEMQVSDKRIGLIPCHECNEEHALSFDNFKCIEDKSLNHSIYGNKKPETAYYTCPHCACIWDDIQKNRNVINGRWQATQESNGIAGFYLNELYSPFYGSRFSVLMEKWLTAQHEASLGDIGALITFINSSMGLPYAVSNEKLSTESLESRIGAYEINEIPAGGLILTAGVDVQHDRLEVMIRAWGRAEESWLICHHKLYGNPANIQDICWADLDKILFSPYFDKHKNKFVVKACSIDSSDGTTSDGVYQYVRNHQNNSCLIMAIKGSSSSEAEIFSKPKQSIDTNYVNTKASKYGLAPFIVGVSKAKDLIIGDRGRLTLSGSGAGRMHYPQGMETNYFEQLQAEVKAPVRRNGAIKLVWQRKMGRPNEAIDLEVYALHATRALKVHLMRDNDWDLIEKHLIKNKNDIQDNSINNDVSVAKETKQDIQNYKSKKRPKRQGWL